MTQRNVNASMRLTRWSIDVERLQSHRRCGVRELVSKAVALVPKDVVIVTSTGSTPAGDVAETEVSLITGNDTAGVVPKSTASAPVKLVPVIVTKVPPDEGPLVGLKLVIVGAGVPAEQTWAKQVRQRA